MHYKSREASKEINEIVKALHQYTFINTVLQKQNSKSAK